jgi:hypothetical protein
MNEKRGIHEARVPREERRGKDVALFACRSLIIAALIGSPVALVIGADTNAGRPSGGKPGLSNIVPPAFLKSRFVPTTKSARLQQLQSLVDSNDWLKDPFRHLQTDMVEVIDDLAGGQTHTPAHVTEPKIISRMDVLIKLLEKQCKGGGGGGNRSPLRRSVLAGGPGGVGDLNAPRSSRRKWAELTPKERERMLQSRTEGFPAGYEEILGEYYRRLATEDSVRAIAPSAAKPDSGKAP